MNQMMAGMEGGMGMHGMGSSMHDMQGMAGGNMMGVGNMIGGGMMMGGGNMMGGGMGAPQVGHIEI